MFFCRFDIAQDVGLIAVVNPAPTCHFLFAGAHRKAVGAGRRRTQIGLGRSKRFGDGRSGMGPTLDEARVSAAIGLIKNLDRKYHGENSVRVD